jgi:hypothetical protein
MGDFEGGAPPSYQPSVEPLAIHRFIVIEPAEKIRNLIFVLRQNDLT